MTGIEPATSTLATSRSNLLSYIRMEPSVRFELTAFSLPRRRSHRWSYEGLAGEEGFGPPQRESKSRGLPISRFPTGASGRCRPGFLPLTRRLRCRCATEAKCARRESDPHGPCGPPAPRAGASTVPPRALRASGRSRTACLPRTKGTLWPGELQRHELGNQGSNLDSLASGASVLPGYTIPHQNTRGPCAARDSNPGPAD
jgi:hypothetical protein